jgi:hypothetical protein
MCCLQDAFKTCENCYRIPVFKNPCETVPRYRYLSAVISMLHRIQIGRKKKGNIPLKLQANKAPLLFRDIHGGWAFEWPATSMLEKEANFVDSFRQVHPNVRETPGL